MKILNTKYVIILTFLLCCWSSHIFSQNKTQFIEINAPTVEQFIQSNSDISLPGHLQEKYDFIIERSKDHNHSSCDHGAYDDIDPEELLQEFQNAYLIDIYQNANGAPKDHPAVAPLCENGGFELASFLHYGGDSAIGSANGYSFGEENSIPNGINFSNSPPLVTGAPDNFLLMSTGNDPLVTAFGGTLSQVNSGNHSARINSGVPTEYGNSCTHYRGINKLSKTALVPEGTDRVNFNFAYIAENPASHINEQPFFLARALNTNGEELDRTWRVSDGSDFFFSLNGSLTYEDCTVQNLVYSDWSCDGLFIGDEDTVIIEFVVADCGQGGHFSYAYVDDICEECGLVDSCEYKGFLEMDPRDPCMVFPTQICGSYEVPTFACTDWPLDEVQLEFVNDMNIVSTTPIIGTIDAATQTFCFNVSEVDLPVGFEEFDFHIIGTFSDGSSDYILEDVHSNPGQNNDLTINCCPEICIECCTLYGPCTCEEIDSLEQLIYVWATDCYGTVLTSSDYNLQWSNGSTGTIATTTVYEEISVVIADPANNCESEDTFLIMCCDSPFLEIDIIWSGNACDPAGQSIIFVRDTFTGTIMPNIAPYVYEWSDGSDLNYMFYPPNTEAWVVVTDTSTGCMWVDSFIYCCDTLDFELVHCLSDLDDDNPAPGQNSAAPSALSIGAKNKLKTMIHQKAPNLTNNEIKALIDEVDDCDPCLQDSILVFVIDPVTLLPVSTGDGYDFEWSDGSTGDVNFLEPGETIWVTITDPNSCAEPWSDTISLICCSSTPPENLSNQYVILMNGDWAANLSWDPVPGATGYIIEFNRNDPTCCNSLLASGAQSTLSTGTSTILNIDDWCCVSWKVRPRCDGSPLGPWSETICIDDFPFTNQGCQAIGPVKPSRKSLESAKVGDFFVDVSPNPASNIVTFSLGNQADLSGNIKLFDVSGKVMTSLDIAGQRSISVDVSKYPKGVYFYQYTDNVAYTESKKLVIE